MPKTSPLVSIAMATYNGEKYIEEQIQTILQQTYTAIELVITDDASTDNTVPIIKKFQIENLGIKLFINTTNSGVTKTFENSIKNCSGDFISISDQDDIWELNKIETLLNAIEEEEDAVYSNSMLVDSNGLSLLKDFKSLMNLQSYYSGAPFFLGNTVPGHTILFRKEFLANLLPFPDTVMFDRWISFCAAANNGLKYVDKVLVKYRQHDSNTFGASKSSKRKHKKSNKEKFEIKRNELIEYEKAPIKSEETKQLLKELLGLFNRRWSVKRTFFFLRNMRTILVIKNKSKFRKTLFCLKMFFKPNY